MEGGLAAARLRPRSFYSQGRRRAINQPAWIQNHSLSQATVLLLAPTSTLWFPSTSTAREGTKKNISESRTRDPSPPVAVFAVVGILWGAQGSERWYPMIDWWGLACSGPVAAFLPSWCSSLLAVFPRLLLRSMAAPNRARRDKCKNGGAFNYLQTWQ